MSIDPVQALRDKIAAQKVIYKSLETDLLTPRLLDSQIESLTEVVAHLPERLDEEIVKATAHLASLQTTRDCKIASKTNQLDQLKHRRDNLKDLYIEADEQLQGLNKQLKRVEHSDTLQKLMRMRAEVAKLESELPDNLKGLESREDLETLGDLAEGAE